MPHGVEASQRQERLRQVRRAWGNHGGDAGDLSWRIL